MKYKNESQKETLEPKKDCVHYRKNECDALTDFVCQKKECTFYKKNTK